MLHLHQGLELLESYLLVLLGVFFTKTIKVFVSGVVFIVSRCDWESVAS